MNRTRILLASAVAALMLSVGSLAAVTFGQAPDHLQDVEKRLSEKRAAAEAHRKQMEGIKDPGQLSIELQRHFQMTEDVLALMLERKKLMEADAPKGASPTAPPAQPGRGGAAGGGPMGGGMQGGGMMQKEMGGMPGGMMEHGMQKEMGGVKGGGMSGMSGQTQPQASQTQPSDMDQMMQRIAEHSRYMETIQDRAALGQEMLRHQKMLDQMLELIQR